MNIRRTSPRCVYCSSCQQRRYYSKFRLKNQGMMPRTHTHKSSEFHFSKISICVKGRKIFIKKNSFRKKTNIFLIFRNFLFKISFRYLFAYLSHKTYLKQMDLQPARQFDYLQRTLSIFLTNPSDMSEQLELLIDELIKENKQINASPKV